MLGFNELTICHGDPILINDALTFVDYDNIYNIYVLLTGSVSRLLNIETNSIHY